MMPERDEPLPELRDASLDEQGLEELLRELGALTEVREVRVKGNATTHGVSVDPCLDDARAALARGAAVQIRYAYRGQIWCDTLMPTGGRVRVVRSSS